MKGPCASQRAGAFFYIIEVDFHYINDEHFDAHLSRNTGVFRLTGVPIGRFYRAIYGR